MSGDRANESTALLEISVALYEFSKIRQLLIPTENCTLGASLYLPHSTRFPL